MQRVAQPVQESDLEQRDRRGLAAELVCELGVQGAQEARVEQHARLAHQQGFRIEEQAVGRALARGFHAQPSMKA